MIRQKASSIRVREQKLAKNWQVHKIDFPLLLHIHDMLF